MKNIKLRIVYLILGSALLLFALFMLAVNLIIPAHFVREAKKALISEAEYQNRTIPYTDDEAFFDDEWNDAEEHFLTPSIVFLELDNANQSSGWNRDAYRLEKKLLEYCAGRDITLDQCYTFKTDRHHLIFMSAQEDYGDGEEPYSYIMYIDIGPITRYIVTLNWVFFAVLLAISSVMCLLGFRFGRDIEKEAERQQTFFQNASHELKTPMTSIAGFIDGILDGTIPPERERHYLTLVSDEVKRLSRLVRSMLNIAKIEAGEMKLNPTVFDVNESVLSSIFTFEQTIDAKHLEIRGLEDTGKIMVEADQDLIHQVVYNLLENAVKFANEGGYVEVSYTVDPKRTYINIKNSGDGIPKDEISKVFDRFYKTDRSRSMDKTGVGLGLYIVRSIVNLHQGEVIARSVEGEYCEFSFSVATAPKALTRQPKPVSVREV